MDFSNVQCWIWEVNEHSLHLSQRCSVPLTRFGGGVILGRRRKGLFVRFQWRSTWIARVLGIVLVQSVAVDNITGELDVVVLHRSEPDTTGLEGVITYRELADFRIVHTEDLGLFAGTKTKTGNQIHQEQDDARSAKGVGKARGGVGKLIGQLDVVAIEPSTMNCGEPVEMRDVITTAASAQKSPRAKRQGTHAAKKPVKRLPTSPPMACTAKMSKASSIPRTNLTFVA